MELNVLEKMCLPIASAIILRDQFWKYVDVNEQFVSLLGYTREEFLKMPVDDIIYDRNNREFLNGDMEQAMQGKIMESDIRCRHRNGTECWVHGCVRVFEQQDDQTLFIATYIPITKQKEAEAAAILLQHKYDLISQTTGEIPFDLDLSNWTVLVSNGFNSVRDEAHQFIGDDYYIPFEESLSMVHPMDRDEYRRLMKEAASKVVTGMLESRINIALPGEKANFQWFRMYYRSIRNEDGKMVRVIGRSYNVDEDKLNREAARRDYLTNFFTKGEIIKAINHQIESNPEMPYVMMVIDIDNFKSINDTFGHTFGDSVISDNANTIRSVLPSNALLGRVGGDEFVALLLDCTIERAGARAQELCDAIAKDYTGAGVVRHISASIGLAEYGKHGDNYEEMFEMADGAMYRVKQKGKSNYQVANKRDHKKLEMRVKETADSRVNLDKEGQQFMIFAVNLMIHARNIDGSLNMLLKRITSQFNFDHILLFENVMNQNYMILSNYQSEQLTFHEKSTFKKDSLIQGGERVNDLQIIAGDEAQNCILFQELYEENDLEMPKNLSIGVAKYEHIGDRDGFVFFMSENENFEWTESLCSLLVELMRIISIFVSLRFRVDESKAEIRHIQRRDQLTGLYNFEPFKVKAVAHIESATENNVFALEYLDINNFGYINENYGYKVGDTVLKGLAEDLKNQPYFVSGCRIYSDFFLILYVGETVESLLEDIRAQHRRFTNMHNFQYPSSGMGISSGIYVVDREFPDMEVAFENAILAWKQSKKERKNEMHIFTSDLRKARNREQQILGEFYEALYRDDFQPYLQPKFELGTRKVYGAEILVRWRKPTGEIIPPGEFIEPLERIGYITELDFYMFEELLRNLTRWSKQGKPALIYSTNFSGRHFENGGKDFMNRIRTLLAKYPVNPNYIELEITEGVLIKEKAVVFECMQSLRELGFRVSIDDFGSGYSSLSTLFEIPADVVKMDKSFIDVELNDHRKDLLSEFCRLINVAGKESVFEGIEEDEQEAFLMDCGYNRGQGFVLSKPVPIMEFEKLYLSES